MINIPDKVWRGLLIAGVIISVANITLVSASILSKHLGGAPWYEGAYASRAVVSIEHIKEMINEGKYKEAGYISSELNSNLWLLRNEGDTAFYDRVYFDKQMNFAFYKLQNNQEHKTQLIADLTTLQQELCPRSNLVNSENFNYHPFNKNASASLADSYVEEMKLCNSDLENLMENE